MRDQVVSDRGLTLVLCRGSAASSATTRRARRAETAYDELSRAGRDEPQPEVRAEPIRLLAELRGPRLTDLAGRALEDPSPLVRKQIAGHLQSWEARPILPAIAAAFERETKRSSSRRELRSGRSGSSRAASAGRKHPTIPRKTKGLTSQVRLSKQAWAGMPGPPRARRAPRRCGRACAAAPAPHAGTPCSRSRGARSSC